MLTTKQYRMRSIFLLSTFFVILVLIFLPLYPDLKPGSKTDGLTYMDNFFNSCPRIPPTMYRNNWKGQKPCRTNF